MQAPLYRSLHHGAQNMSSSSRGSTAGPSPMLLCRWLPMQSGAIAGPHPTALQVLTSNVQHLAHPAAPCPPPSHPTRSSSAPHRDKHVMTHKPPAGSPS